MMPMLSGLELCQTLTSLSFTRSIPIFAITGEPAAKHKDFYHAALMVGNLNVTNNFVALFVAPTGSHVLLPDARWPGCVRLRLLGLSALARHPTLHAKLCSCSRGRCIPASLSSPRLWACTKTPNLRELTPEFSMTCSYRSNSPLMHRRCRQILAWASTLRNSKCSKRLRAALERPRDL
jgi:CheY-like chemotaxis protein